MCVRAWRRTYKKTKVHPSEVRPSEVHSLLGLGGRGLLRIFVIRCFLAVLAIHLLPEARLLGVLVGGGSRVEVTVLRRLCDEPLELLLHGLLLRIVNEAVADWQERRNGAAQAWLPGRRRLLAEIVGAIVAIRDILDGIGQVHLVLLVVASAGGRTVIVR